MSGNRSDAYAEAIVAIATGEGALEVVEDEFLTIARAVENNNELREKLVDIHLPVADRLKLVDSAVLATAHPATKTAVSTVVAAGRAGDLGDIAQRVAELGASARGRELAEVRVAAPLDDATRDRLKSALERATGKQLDMKVLVDDSVVGGVLAKVGDTVIDGSISRRLSDIKARLGA